MSERVKAREKKPVVELTFPLYQHVIDDTMARVKSEFVERGIDETVHERLRALWEFNLQRTLAATDDNTKNRDKTNATEKDGGGSSHHETADASERAHEGGSNHNLGQPVQKHELLHDDIIKKRTLEELSAQTHERPTKQPHIETSTTQSAPAHQAFIPQRDGASDDEDEDGEELLGSDLDDSEIDELNEDDDLADVDNHETIDESKVGNVVLGQFERVHRSKSKWKVNLKSCIARVNGKDYLFKKLTGEMDFS